MEGARGRVQVMACLVGVLCAVGQAAPTSDPHGGVVMGNANNNCDDAKVRLRILNSCVRVSLPEIIE